MKSFRPNVLLKGKVFVGLKPDLFTKYNDHFAESFKNPEYLKAWLEDTLTTFLNTGNVDEFVECLIDVVKNSKRGEITRIANEAGINRSNLYDIMNGKVTPRIDTAFKLIRGLGYKYEIKLQSA